MARDLHDSVSQTLFSANSIAEALPRIIDNKPDKARDYMQNLSQLTRIAQTEMRTLLVELRPEALVKTEINLLLEQLCDAFAGNTKIEVNKRISANIILPDKHQIAFYRIAQEALNNVTKHAQATRVNVSLDVVEDMLVLEIADNGKGFSSRHDQETHLGLVIMRERAEAIGALLTIDSRQGEGVTVTLRGAIQ